MALVGPTAVGKSALAFALAQQFGAHIVSVDSMQVYRGMDIGTAKPTAAERRVVPHLLLDLADPAEEYSLAQYQAEGEAALAALAGERVILVGGTGLYLRALCDGLSLPGQWPELRRSLEQEADEAGVEALHLRLRELDPAAAARMEPTNRRRVVRALEVCLGSGRPFSSFGPGLGRYPAARVDFIGLDRPRPELDARIEARYAQQMSAGFLEEVDALRARPGGLSRTARQALGYRELLEHLENGAPLDDVLTAAKARTRRFARRQQSWFRRDPRIQWLVGGPETLSELSARLGECWS